MKKIIMILVICLIGLLVEKVQAQDFYLRAGGGYIVETGKTQFNNADPNGLTQIQQSTEVTVSADGTTANIKALDGTLGGGFKFNLTGGYMFNPYIGTEVGVNYFVGDKKTIGSFSNPQLVSSEQAYIRGIDILPALYLTPALPGLNPYARIGLILTGGGKLNIDTHVRQIDGGGAGTDIWVAAKSQVKSEFSAGFAGALGATYPISDKLSLFGELEFKNFSVKSKSAEIVSYSTTAVNNGQSQLVPGQQLADLTVSEKKFVFTDNFNQSTNNPPPANEPRNIPTQFVNTSGAGLNVGIRYVF
jgi:outer membrane protein W